MTRELMPVIRVDEEKCVNCHACIAACPVKFCIDGSGDKVSIRHELCIGCGSCIEACTHEARKGIDDIEAFLAALSPAREAWWPSSRPPSPPTSPRISSGSTAGSSARASRPSSTSPSAPSSPCKSYLEHIKAAEPALVIAQPCPALVTYIEIYRPELLPHLAPADSPMLHTMKMIKAVLSRVRGAHGSPSSRPASPSGASSTRRAWATTTSPSSASLEHFESAKDRPRRLPRGRTTTTRRPSAPCSSPAPAASRRPSSGRRPSSAPSIRKIEGPRTIYPYLDSLPEALRAGRPARSSSIASTARRAATAAPARARGHVPSTSSRRRSRSAARVQRERLGGTGASAGARRAGDPEERHPPRWKPGLYDRAYVDRSASLRHRAARPRPSSRRSTASMRKEREEDFLNCASCGYGSCEHMAIAILNGLNKPENCHHYRHKVLAEGQGDRRRMARPSTASSASGPGPPRGGDVHDPQALDLRIEQDSLPPGRRQRLEDSFRTLKRVLGRISAERQAGPVGPSETASGVQSELAGPSRPSALRERRGRDDLVGASTRSLASRISCP